MKNHILSIVFALLLAYSATAQAQTAVYDVSANLPSLEVTPGYRDIYFSYDGKSSISERRLVTPTFCVTTNANSWEAESNQPWVKVAVDKDNNTFTLAADSNTGSEPFPRAKVTVTAGTANPVTFTVDNITVDNIAGITNRVFNADPCILLHNDVYYSYGTNHSEGIEVYTSDDLLLWKRNVYPLALHKDDTYTDRNFWAPDVAYVNGQFYMCFSGSQRICIATADSPLGPFRQEVKKPLIDNVAAVDNCLFIDDDSKAYMFYSPVVSGGGQEIWMAELEENLTDIKPGTIQKCLAHSLPWENVANQRIVEGPYVIKHNGVYYMTYSANGYEYYEIGVATATDVHGPWTKYEHNPVFPFRVGHLKAPGHNTLFIDKEGKLRIVFHSHFSESQIHPRIMHISTVNFKQENGKEVLTIDPGYLTPGWVEQQGRSAPWSKEQANLWYQQRGWLRGCNFTPSTAVNQLEMWQAATFDPVTIDRELGWAAAIGMNCMRVYLHHVAWEIDRDGFKKRMGQYLDIADHHSISTIFVFFDDCWTPTYSAGQQPAPQPGVHNSGWLRDPGDLYYQGDTAKILPVLEAYVKDILTTFKDDKRIVLWDLYNEPGGSNPYGMLGDRSLPLLQKIFAWGWTVNPSQPLSAGYWNDKLPNLNKFQLENSDVITYHTYQDLASHRQVVEALKHYGRPMICTEYMARHFNSTFQEIMPMLKSENIGAINWGLVAGKTNTIFKWAEPFPELEEPPLWFHDIFRKDGTPYLQEEIDVIKALCGKSNE